MDSFTPLAPAGQDKDPKLHQVIRIRPADCTQDAENIPLVRLY